MKKFVLARVFIVIGMIIFLTGNANAGNIYFGIILFKRDNIINRPQERAAWILLFIWYKVGFSI